jgi:hypothetical protein
MILGSALAKDEQCLFYMEKNHHMEIKQEKFYPLMMDAMFLFEIGKV